MTPWASNGGGTFRDKKIRSLTTCTWFWGNVLDDAVQDPDVLLPEGVITEAAARLPVLEPKEVWGEAAAQFDPVKGALVVK